MAEAELLYEVKERAAWMTINREARRNALSPQVIELFDEYLNRAEQNPEIQVICITGVGQKSFCSGADLMSTMGGGGALDATRAYARLLERMASYPKPLVARVNGHCVAGGLGLLLSCDMAYAREGTKFGTPEVSVGLFPMMVTALMIENAVRKKALELMFTAQMISAEEAAQMGLVTRVYPADTLDEEVAQKLRQVSAQAPLALRMGRQALAAIRSMALGEALDYLCDRLGELLQTEDAKEGLMAFLQKREPRWGGR